MRSQLGTKFSELGFRRQFAVPEKPGSLFERRVRGELADRESGDDQFARFTIDVTQARGSGDDALESTGDIVVAWHGDNVNGSGRRAPLHVAGCRSGLRTRRVMNTSGIVTNGTCATI